MDVRCAVHRLRNRFRRLSAPRDVRLNLGSGDKTLDGFENLDSWLNGWRFEHGLPYASGTVEGITVSHALMYVPEEKWPYVFKEFRRALKTGGVVRITEDDTTNPDSERYGGYGDQAILTDSEVVCRHLEAVGLTALPVQPDETHYTDDSLIQQLHGDPPKVFHVEGIKRAG